MSIIDKLECNVSLLTKGFIEFADANQPIVLNTEGKLYKKNDDNGLFWKTTNNEINLANPPNLTDYTNVNGPIDKVDLNTVTSQLGYGSIYIFKAQNDIQCGEPVVYSYDNGRPNVSSISQTPNQSDIAGISLESVNSNSDVIILVNGYTTARYDTQTVPNITAGTVLYLDSSNNKLTSASTSQLKIGKCVYGNTDNDSLFCKIEL